MLTCPSGENIMNDMTVTQESGMETDDRTSEIHHFQMLMKDEEMKMLKYKVNSQKRLKLDGCVHE